MSLDAKKFTIDFQGEPLTLEVSRLAEQASGAVLGTYGDTVVLATVVMGKKDSPNDFLPLMVEYEQKFYAAGKILGSRFVRREGRAPDSAVLSGRLIDRTIRPLFDYRMRRDVQVVASVLSFDEEHSHEFVALMAVSAALACSNIPWAGPVAGVPIATIEGKSVVAPKFSQLKNWTCDGFVAGTKEYISMIELEGKEVQEADAMDAFGKAQQEIARLVDFQNEMVKAVGKKKTTVKLVEASVEIREKIEAFLDKKLEAAMYMKVKMEREEKMSELRESLKAFVAADESMKGHEKEVDGLLEEILDRTVHEQILKKDRRPDGRAMDELRELSAEIHLYERLHGSALFMRGNTQALAVTTLASTEAGKLVETMDYAGTKHFLLHYNFPPFSVGEVKPLRGPSRRDIGHGALAEKALNYVLPNKENFPYTIRVVSEILSSNGSSSMATVCAASMSMMDAGVPIKKAAAGIAMGLMSDEEGNYKILTDIQGPEDFYGDMDFKVAGTRDGVTAIQLDVKIRGLSLQIIKETLAQTKRARLQILDAMTKAIERPRANVSKYAPVIVTLAINPEKIGLLIGPGGKTINGLIAKFGALAIDIEEDGKVFIAGATKEIAESVLREVEALTKEYKVGDVIHGKVIKILEFGAIVDLGGGNDGMIHVSELKEGFVKKVEDVVKVGDELFAKVVRVEDGRIGLSLKGMGKH